MELGWNFHEVAKGKVPLSWSWGGPHVKINLEESWTHLGRFMKLIEYFGNIDWKIHELAWNLHEIEFAHLWSHLSKGVIYTSNLFGSLDAHIDLVTSLFSRSIVPGMFPSSLHGLQCATLFFLTKICSRFYWKLVQSFRISFRSFWWNMEML